MLKNFCHDQIKLLLERMDSHPEEFIHGTKWNPYLPNTHHVTKGTTDYFPILNFAERNAIARKFNKLCLTAMRQNAYNRVLEKIFESEVPSNWAAAGNHALDALSLTTQTPTWTTSIANTITVGDQTLTANDIKKLKHKTLLGKLFV
jgi:hypothetical protein